MRKPGIFRARAHGREGRQVGSACLRDGRDHGGIQASGEVRAEGDVRHELHRNDPEELLTKARPLQTEGPLPVPLKTLIGTEAKVGPPTVNAAFCTLKAKSPVEL